MADLKPKVNAQPAFRRANPEGGFISVRITRKTKLSKSLTIILKPLQALTSHLPSTYRICNPSFKYESSRNPRRVLTKPSKGVKNDGFDNEDSDYILYVNDILGSEETGHKYDSPCHYQYVSLTVCLGTAISSSMFSARVRLDKLSSART
jgi:dual specificity protein kinase YAK1